MDNKSIFKSTMFGGFERQSVLNYIYETFNSTQEAQDRLTAQIEEMSVTRERLEQSVKDLENRLSENDVARNSMGEELQGVKVKNTELTAMLTSLNEEIDRQKLIVKEKDEQIGRLTRTNTELEQKYAQLELQARDQGDSEETKAHIAELEKRNAHLERQAVDLTRGQGDIEKSKVQIGELVVKSHLEAERILEQANERAQEVIAEADAQAREVVSEAGIQAQEVIAEAGVRAEQIAQAANRSSNEVAAHLSGFRDEIDRLRDLMEEAFDVMRDKFSAISKALDKSESQMKSSGPRPGGNHIVLAPHIAGEKQPSGESLSQMPQAGEFF